MTEMEGNANQRAVAEHSGPGQSDLLKAVPGGVDGKARLLRLAKLAKELDSNPIAEECRGMRRLLKWQRRTEN